MAKPGMKVSLASIIRDIVATLSINNLKEYLNKAQGSLPSSSILKSIIVREILNKSTLKDEDIKATYKKLKEIIKGYDLSNRKPFQKIILGPLQGFFDKANPFIPEDLLKTIREYKETLGAPERELSKSNKNVKDLSKIQVGPRVLD